VVTRLSRAPRLAAALAVLALAAAIMAGAATVALPATGTTYYVDSVNGADTRSGTSEATAWKSLTKASSASLAPGDRLLLKRGGFWREKLDVSRSGTATAPIAISAYGSGNRPMLTRGCVSLRGSYLTLSEFRIDNCTFAGVDVFGDDNRVADSRITGSIAGVFIRPGAVRNWVVRNLLENNNRMSVLTSSPSNDDSGAFGVLIQGDRTTVALNTISGSDTFSYDYGRDGAAVEIFGGQRNVIRHNVAIDNHTFSELGNPRSADNTYAYNVVRSSLPASTLLVTRGAVTPRGPIYRTSLYNNTVLLTGASSEGFICHAGCSSEILKMRNNIIQAVVKVGYADAPFDEDYNLYFGGQAQFARGSHSLVADPRFADPASGNLRLRPPSPAIDRGVALGYRIDLDGRSLPQDGNADGVAAPDLGAYERAAASTAPPPVDPVIAAAGDISPTSSNAGNKRTSDLLVANPPTRVLTLGDNQYPDGALADLNAYYSPTWGRLKSITSPALGNHDQHLAVANQGFWPFFGPAAGAQGKGFYSYDLGAWHLIALNSGCGSSSSAPNSPSCAVGSEQERWLRSDLAAHSNKCTLAYWHHSRFSTSTTSGATPAVQPFVQAAYDYGVDVILNGHAHVYERFAPQNPSAQSDATRGFRQFTVGTGGVGLYSFGSPAANSEVRYNGGFGVLRVTLRSDRYEWRYESEAGKTFTDSGSTLCR
jgi:hypothetical protein